MSEEVNLLKDIRRILKKILQIQMMPYKIYKDDEHPALPAKEV